jgi:CHAD domain-containing protein
MRLSELYSTSARDGATRLRDAEALIRGGDVVAGVHQMRTASRRLRSSLKYLGGHLPGAMRRLLTENLKELMTALGPVRDLDVLAGAVGAALDARDAEPLGATVNRRRERPALRMLARLNGAEHATLLRGLEESAAHSGGRAVALAGPERVTRAVAEVLAAKPATWEAAEDESLHDLRKTIKKLRYALEAFQPGYGRPMTRMISACREIQEALGAIQDTAAFGELLRGVRTFAAGQFLATAKASAGSARARMESLWRGAFGPRMLGRLGAHLLRRAARIEPNSMVPAASESA